MKQLTKWVFTELEEKNSLFGIPRDLFFVPQGDDPFRTSVYGQPLETPFGVAAGPHTQMAQNLIASWACGARFMELKTVQTLDELDVAKPCIDMEDEGYNVEWSQELKIKQSFDEYLRAWVLLHALHKKLGFPGDAPGMIFNMSVGYNYEGILKDNVQWFLKHMQDAGALKDDYISIVAQYCPEIRDMSIPSKLSDNVTLSTMHGCPPEEIGKIAAYLIEEWGLHTNVKLNPTLLGPERLRFILNQALGFDHVTVPDEAFAHDLKYPDAVNLLNDLLARAEEKGVTFGVKLSNTLEVENNRDVFNAEEKMMYMSGRPLQGVTVNLAAKISEQYDGKILMSYAGGADAFNVYDLLACGMRTITVSSDLLKSGGYMRLAQYVEDTASAMEIAGAANLDTYITGRCSKPECNDPQSCALENLRDYAQEVLEDALWKAETYDRGQTKTERALGLFDCIYPPCMSNCPISQNVPRYMDAVRRGAFDEAIDIVRGDNPMPSVLGRACTHVCEHVCVRTHYDEPLAIREIKRFIMDQEKDPRYRSKEETAGIRVGVVGGGPCGLGAAYFLCQAGCDVTIYESREYTGGMVQGTIPGYRATQESIEQDMEVIKALGAEIKFGQQAGRDFTLAELKEQYDYVIVAAGAQRGMPMGIPNEDAPGVLEALEFLRRARHGDAPQLGKRIGVIGGGDVAMDCARTAKRLTGGDVQVIYRRTRKQMPAEKEEITALLEEGIEILELAAPAEVLLEDGKLNGLRCIRMQLGEPDESGRRRPVPVEGSEFDVPLDNLIVAIGQKPDLEFAREAGVELNRKGYIEIDPETMKTSVAGILAGGDAVLNGPETIVKAFGDGKKLAASIAGPQHAAAAEAGRAEAIDFNDLMIRRAHREWRVPVQERSKDDRAGFDEVVETLDAEAAQKEAGRCLECDKICSLCATVCPNRAIQTYACEPFEVDIPEVEAADSSVAVVATRSFRVNQRHQVVVQTDFCNECGNCRTFCPTSGAPYRDKPRLYLNHAEFAAEKDNAFMFIEKEGVRGIRAKYNGDIHELMYEEDKIAYCAYGICMTFEPERFELVDSSVDVPVPGNRRLDLRPCAEMYFLFKNIPASLPYLPVVGD
jgi:putative selenate reductase